ncbi:hypothetical protein SAMN05421765_1523 [Kaistella antarctica]|uniref:Uncharacterized protein n=1 Tax=Kaistella antarctica TaxID=266748 RepID=A0A448NN53_9FLAO|nr:hypothetical protein HY04_01260 [Kaistella antarctica]SEV96411.1 hypothetical protein SAMN05421765_1523 [Kaistella antarctica]VEH96217.1 Uncharacterised protein [Kaistella antarctica]
MKAIFLLFVFICGLVFCKSQHNNVILKNVTTEHLKIGDQKKEITKMSVEILYSNLKQTIQVRIICKILVLTQVRLKF